MYDQILSFFNKIDDNQYKTHYPIYTDTDCVNFTKNTLTLMK